MNYNNLKLKISLKNNKLLRPSDEYFVKNISIKDRKK